MPGNKKSPETAYFDGSKAFSVAGWTRLELATSGLTGRGAALYISLNHSGLHSITTSAAGSAGILGTIGVNVNGMH